MQKQTTNLQAIRDKVQAEIDYLGHYKIEPENEYCFCLLNDRGDSITATVIDMINAMGYMFIHCQLKNGSLVARFTYKEA